MKMAEALDKFLDLLRRMRFYEIVLFLAVLIILGAWSVKEITESALFCGNTCHVMRPFYRDWQTSSHRDVSCVQCHIPPSDEQQFVPRFRALEQVAGYMTRSHRDGQRAEVADASCLTADCHSRRLLEGKVSFLQGVEFDHSPHLRQLRRGKILRCTTCHSQVAMGEHITVTKDTCYLCHFKDIPPDTGTARCRLCHSEIDRAFTHEPYLSRGADCTGCHAGIVRGNGEIIPESCHECHPDPGPAAAERSAEVLHRLHITDHKVECSHCHLSIRHSLPEPGRPIEADCATCHENRHAGILKIYSGSGARGVPKHPSAMFSRHVSCQACHLVPDRPPGSVSQHTGTTLVAMDAACDKCHDEDAARTLHALEREVDRELVKSATLLRRLEGAIADAAPGVVTPEIRRVYENARHNILFVRASAPIHNPEYAIKVLDHSNRELTRVGKLLEQR